MNKNQVTRRWSGTGRWWDGVPGWDGWDGPVGTGSDQDNFLNCIDYSRKNRRFLGLQRPFWYPKQCCKESEALSEPWLYCWCSLNTRHLFQQFSSVCFLYNSLHLPLLFHSNEVCALGRSLFFHSVLARARCSFRKRSSSFIKQSSVRAVLSIIE